jgi:hypothetical protein
VAAFANDRNEVVITSRNRLENAIETRAWEIPPPDQSPGAGKVPPGTTMHFVRIELAPGGRYFTRVSTFPPLTPMPVRGPDGKLRPGPAPAQPPQPALELYSIADGKRLAEGPLTSAPSSQAVFSADARRIVLIHSTEPALVPGVPSSTNASGGTERDGGLDVQVLDVPSLKPAWPVVHLDKPVGALAISPDGRRLAVVRVGQTVTSLGGAIRKIDTKTGRELPIQVTYLDALRVYDLQTGRLAPETFRMPKSNMPQSNPVSGLLFGPDGKRLLVRPARPSGYVAGHYVLPPFLLLDVDSLRPVGRPLEIVRPSGANTESTESLPGFGAFDRLDVFSPNGRLVAIADGGNLAGVFDDDTGKHLEGAAWPSHPGRILWISFSPDGRRLATTGSEGTARIWDAATGTPLAPPIIHPGVVQAEFNADGTFLITASGQGQVRVWDALRGDLLSKGLDFQRGVDAIGTGPGPRRVVFALHDQAMPVTWDILVEDRPIEQLEALSLVLSGHVIDSGEGLSPASPQQVEAARASLVRRQPDLFPVSAPSPSPGSDRP